MVEECCWWSSCCHHPAQGVNFGGSTSGAWSLLYRNLDGNLRQAGGGLVVVSHGDCCIQSGGDLPDLPFPEAGSRGLLYGRTNEAVPGPMTKD